LSQTRRFNEPPSRGISDRFSGGLKVVPVRPKRDTRYRLISHHRGTDRPRRESELAPSPEIIRRLRWARLIYATPTSLDGYIADETGNPDWAAPDEEGFAFINDLLRPIGLYHYGRKMYETMAIWETPDVIAGLTSAMLNFARIWQAADQIVQPLTA
jgi:hypothetical protein